MNKNTRKLSDYIPQPKISTNNTKQIFNIDQRPEASIPLIKITQTPTRHGYSQSEVSKTFIQGPINESLFTSSSKSSSLATNSSGMNRLKLKDYLHLNSIQKKSKGSRSKENNSIEPQNKKDRIGITSQSQGNKSLSSKDCTSQNSYLNSMNTRSIMKSQIQKQIKQHISKLNSLSQYIAEDFVQNVQESQSTLILFNLIKTLKENENNFAQLGKNLADYESRLEAFPEKNKKYFWNQQLRLQSPAKMLERGLELTSKTAKYFHMLGLKP